MSFDLDMAPKATGNKPFTGTDVVHADDHVPHGLEVAPAISVTTSKYNSTSTEAVGLIQGLKRSKVLVRGMSRRESLPSTHGIQNDMSIPATLRLRLPE